MVPPPEPYASSSAYFPTASNNDMVSRYKVTFGAAAAGAAVVGAAVAGAAVVGAAVPVSVAVVVVVCAS